MTDYYGRESLVITAEREREREEKAHKPAPFTCEDD